MIKTSTWSIRVKEKKVQTLRRKRSVVKCLIIGLSIVTSLVAKNLVGMVMGSDIMPETKESAPVITSFTPTNGSVGTLVTIIGTNLNSPTALTIGGVSALEVSNDGTQLVAMVMPGATTGAIGITTANGSSNSSSNFAVSITAIPTTQYGPKLVGTGATGTMRQGRAVAISSDGNTAVVGTYEDDNQKGAVWVYTLNSGFWEQQGSKLVGTGITGQSRQGQSVDISADGNTIIVGGPKDDGSNGAAWVFTRSAGVWSQFGSKLVGDYTQINTGRFGWSVSLSADGKRALIGGRTDGDTGAAWLFYLGNSGWSQHGDKLVGTGAVGNAWQGNSVSLSADGNTAIIGGHKDDGDKGAVWVFKNVGDIWSQQGAKLVGTGTVGAAQQGQSVSLSADGNTAIVGGVADNANQGAVWIFTRTSDVWSQQGSKLVGTGAVGSAQQGHSVDLSADGDVAIVGGNNDNGSQGAAWMFTRSGTTWSQQGSKLLGVGNVGGAKQGQSVSLSADGITALVGGHEDHSDQGAAWLFSANNLSTDATLSAMSLSAGTLSPVFDANTASYTSIVANDVSSTTLTPTSSDANAVIEIQFNGGGYNRQSSGTASNSLSLNQGENTIDVRVTAQNGAFSKNYSINLTRLAVAPKVLGLVLSGSPSSTASSVNFTLTFDNPVTGVDPTDFTINASPELSGASVSGVSGSGTSYTVTVSGIPNGSDGILSIDLKDSGTGITSAGGGIPLGFSDGDYHYVGNSFNVSEAIWEGSAKLLWVGPQEDVVMSLAFNSDGTILFVVGNTGDRIIQYALSTPYEVATATYMNGKDLALATVDATPRSMAFNNDGTKLFVLGGIGDDINEFILTSAYDVSTATFSGDSESFSVNAQEADPYSFEFNNNGSKLFVIGFSGDDVNEYSLTTPFDVSTASYTGDSERFSFEAQERKARSFAFSPSGMKMYVTGIVNDDISVYNMTSPFDVSTASYLGDAMSFNLFSQDSRPSSILFKPDGTRMYMVGIDASRVYQYRVGTGPNVTISEGSIDGSQYTANITLSEPVTDFAKEDLIIGNGTAISLTKVNDLSYTAVISIAAEGNMTIDIPEGKMLDVAGNINTEATQFVYNHNSAPVFTSGLSANFAENGSNIAYTATATDTSPITFSIDGGDDASKFSINNGQLSFKVAPNFENPTDDNGDNSYLITLKASDGVNDTRINVGITVTDVDEILPVFTSATATTFAENANAVVYTVQATDANPITYSLGINNDEGHFNISNGEITFKSAPDFENPSDQDGNNIYLVEVRANDGVNEVFQAVNISVTDKDENAPAFTSSSGVSFAENGTGTVYAALATDATVVTYSLGTGNDEELFSISGNAISFKNAPDFEDAKDADTNNAYVIQVKASDVEGNMASQLVTITVTDLAENPEFTSIPITNHNNNQNYRYDINVTGFEHINVTGTNIPSWLTLKNTTTLSTLAGNGTAGSNNGVGTSAFFNSPRGVAIDKTRSYVYVIDQGQTRVRRMSTKAENVTYTDHESFRQPEQILPFNPEDGWGFSGLVDVAVDDLGSVYPIDATTIWKFPHDNHFILIGAGQIHTQMRGIVFDDFSKSLYISDANQIRRVHRVSGEVVTIAGSISPGNANGQGTNASFNGLKGLTTDAQGNIYAADTANHLIRKITPDGLVSTFAGSGSNADVDGQGTSASFSYPKDIEIDQYGNLYVVTGSNKVRKITPSGLVSTITGTGATGFNNGDGNVATFNDIQGIAIDKNGVLYISDKNNHAIRKIVISSQLEGNPNGLAGNFDVALKATDTKNRAADQNFTIAVRDITVPNITSPSLVTFQHQGTETAYTVVATDDNSLSYSLGTGNDEALFNISGATLTFKTPPDFNNPTDSDGNNTYVVEVKASDGTNTAKQNVTISILDGPPVFTSNPVTSVDNTSAYKYDITTTGSDIDISATTIPSWLSLIKNISVETLAGSGTQGSTNASGTAASFASPRAIAVDNGNFHLYSIDQFGTSVRRSNLFGGAVTFVTNASFTNTDLVTSKADGFGFQKLEDITVDGTGNVYMVDSEVHGVYKLANDGHILSLSGFAQGTADGNGILVPPGRTGPDAQYNAPTGIVYDFVSSSLYVSDGNRIRKVDPNTGDAITIAGSGSAGSANGLGTAATFNGLKGLTTDANGNIYAADTANHLIRKITPAGLVSTFAGSGSNTDTDGAGTLASFNSPKDIVIDLSGNLYVVTGGNKIRKITPAGIVTTIAGTGIAGFDNGNGAASTFNGITSIAMGPALNFYLTDKDNHAIRKLSDDALTLSGTPTGLVGEFDVSLTATDDQARSTKQDFKITVNDVVDPVFTSATAVNFAENATTAAYTSVVTDASPVTFSLGTGNDEALFNIANGVITFKSAPDFENPADGDNNNSYIIEIKALDAANNAKTQQATITVTDVVEDLSAPVITSATTTNFTENGTGAVYVISATDNNTITYALGTGNDEAGFDLNGATVTFKNIPDFEVKSSYTIEVQANDGINVTKQTVTITIVDVDEINPVFTSPTTVSFAENGTGTAYTILAADANPVSYTLGTGNDEAGFDLNGATVTFKNTPDFEVKSSYTIEVQANDGSNVTKQTVTITIVDVDEINPVFTSPTTASFAENGTGTAYTILATDTNPVTYSLGTGNDEGLFNINGGLVTFKAKPDFETPNDGDGNNSYIIKVIANDGTLTVSQDVTITVTDINEAAPKVVSIKRQNPTNEFTVPASNGKITFRVTFNEPVENVSTDDFQVATTANFPEFEFRFLTLNAVSATVYDVTIDGISGNGGMDLNFTSGQNIKNLTDIAFEGTIDLEETYTIDTSSPVIQSGILNSVAKTFVKGDHVDITVVYNEAVVVNTNTGVPFINLPFSSGNKSANYLSGSGTKTIVFRYTIEDGDSGFPAAGSIENIKLTNGGTIQDFVPHDADLTISVFSAHGNKVDAKKPVITSSSIATRTYALGHAMDVEVNFDEVVIVNTANGTPSMTIDVGGVNKTADYVSGSGTSTIKFRYITQVGDTDDDGVSVSNILLNAGTIKDANDNDAKLESITTGADGVRVDTKAPAILSATIEAKTYRKGDFLDVIVKYDEEVIVDASNGTPYIPIEFSPNTNAKKANYHSGSGTTALVFRYVMSFENDEDGVTVLDIVNSANKIEDAAGNDATINTANATGQDGVKADNLPPNFTSPDKGAFLENSSGAVYTAVATDVNPVSYSLGSSNDESLFNIVNDVLSFKTPPDFENPADKDGNNTYLVEVIASDGLNLATWLVTITVTDADEEKPVFTSGISASFLENSNGVGVYTSQATDAGSVTFSLGTSNDEQLFKIINGVVKPSFSADFENPIDADKNNTYLVEVIASDGLNVAAQLVTITVIDVDENAPVFTSSTTASYAENGFGIAYKPIATDESPVTYSLGTSNDSQLFSMSGSDVIFKTRPDFESPNDANNDNVYVIEVIASDGNKTANQFVTITVTNIDDTAPVFTSPSTVNFVENSTALVYAAKANDESPITFTLGDCDEERFFNMTTDGIVSFKAAPDFENPIDNDRDNVYVIEILASDGSRSAFQRVTITVTDLNEVLPDIIAPVFASGKTQSYKENSNVPVYTIVATDANPIIYSLGIGNDESLFNIVGSVVSFKNAPDFENPNDKDANNSYLIEVLANDGLNTASQTVTITITDIDEILPVFTSSDKVDFIENGTATVYTITATDANAVTYSLGTGNDEAFFNLNGEVVTFKSSPDFEVKSSYVIEVRANDGLNTANQTVTITITDVDEIKPVFTSSNAVDFVENGAGTAYTAVATDANAVTYSLGTGNDEALFNIVEGIITFKNAPNFETPTDSDTNNSYRVEVKANDGLNIALHLVTITVTDLDESTPDVISPVFTSTSKVSFIENGTGTVYTITATDANAVTYSLGTGNDEAFFNLDGGVVTFKSSPDFEVKSSYVIEVRANDGLNEAIQTVTITITDIDEILPVFTSSDKVDFVENGTGTAYTAVATDANAVTYSLGTSNDEAFFDLNGGFVTFKSFPDFEVKSSYVIEVRANDGLNEAVQTVTITITDVDEILPVFISATAVNYEENGIGTAYTIVATDANAVTYSLGTDNDESFFNLAAGVVTFKSSPDFELKSSYVIEVRANDGLNEAVQTVTITITDVDEILPVFTSATAVNYEENGIGTAYTIAATDANTVTYSLGTGNDEAFFNLAAGVVTFKSSPDFEVKSIYTLKVNANDGLNETTQTVVITIIDIDEVNPVFTSATAVNFAENGTGTAYTIAATDANAVTYSLGAGNDEAFFDLNEGVVTFKAAPDFEVKSSYVIEVRANDGLNETTQTVVITIINIDEVNPVFTSATAVNFVENGTGTAHTITATDASALTYSLGTGNDEALFDLTGDKVTFKASPDFETPKDSGAKNTYLLEVIATDALGNTSSQVVTITVTDADEVAPTVILSSNSSALVFRPGFKVTFTFSEPVTGFEVSDLTITNGSATAFTGSGNTYSALITATVDGQVSVSLAKDKAEDAAGNSNLASNILSRTVEATNLAPSAVDLSANTVTENTALPVEVGTLSAVDADENDKHAFALVDGEGSTDNSLFRIIDDKLIARSAFDYETAKVASVRIRATDARGLSLDVIKQIEVLNVAEPLITVFLPSIADPLIGDTNLAFEAIRTGQTATRTLEVTNSGTDGDLSVTDITLPTGFTIDKTTATIAQGQKEVLIVTFSPTEVKTYAGSIVISSNAGEKKVQVGGRGKQNRAPIAVSPGVEIFFKLSDLLQLRGYDPDGDAIEFVITQQPIHGTITATSAGLYSFVTNGLTPGQTYQDVLKFKVVETGGGLESTEAELKFKFKVRDQAHAINSLVVNSKTEEKMTFDLKFSDPVLNDAYQLKVNYYDLSDPTSPVFVPMLSQSVAKSGITTADGVHGFSFEATSTGHSYFFSASRVFMSVELTTANGYSASDGYILRNEGSGANIGIIEGAGSEDGEFFVFASQSSVPENESVEVNLYAVELGSFSLSESTIAITKSALKGTSTSPVEVKKTDNLAQWKLTYSSDTEIGLLDSLQFTVTHPERDADADAYAKVEVIEVADAPELDAIADQQINEEETITLDLVVSDPDSELTITATSSESSNVPVTVSDNKLTITPGKDFNGTANISVLVTESNSESALSTFDEFQLTVIPVNDKPVMTAISDLTVVEDGQVVVTLSATDVDAELPIFTYAASADNQDNVSYTLEGDVLTITPSANYNGTITFGVTADDGEGTTNSVSDSEAFTITVSAQNDAPTSSATINTQTLLEAIPAYTLDLAQYFTDVETAAEDLTYTVSSVGNADLSITGATLTITSVAGASGVEIATVTASDGELSVSQNVTFVATTANTEVTVANPVTDQVLAEDFGLSSIDLSDVFALSGNTNASFTYVLTGNNTIGASMNGSVLELTSVDDFNGADELIIIGTADGKSSFTSFKITVSPANDAPSLASPINDVSTAEDAALSQVISANAFSDVDGDVLSYSASFTAAWLSFDATTRTFSGTPANADVGTVAVTVTATDPSGAAATDSFNIVVSNTNDDPTAITFTSKLLDENIALSSLVSDLTSVDPDAGDDSFTYTLVSGTGDTDNSNFAIVGNQLVTASAVDFESKASYSIRIKTTDGFEGSFTEAVTLIVNNVNEVATDLDLPVTVIAENQAAGSIISTLTTTDPDAADSHSYSLVSGTGDTDNSSFTITDGKLTAAASFDFEAKSSYAVRIKTADAGGLSFEKSFTVTVTNVNEVATDVNLSAATIAENASISAEIADLTTTDPDAGDTHAYSLVTGEGDGDNANFKIEGTKLLAASSFNFENRSSYSLRLKSTDAAGLSFEKQFTITVTDVNDAPSGLSADNLSIEENQDSGTTIGSLTTTDQDNGDTHSYSLVAGDGDADNASFTLDGNVLKAGASYDFETKDSYTVRVKTTDAGGLSFETAMTVAITNQAEAQMRVENNDNLDPTALGTTATFNITVFNDGDGAMNVTGIIYPEGFSGASSISEITASGSTELTVSFSPTEAKTYSGNIVLTYNGGEQAVTVSALGEIVTAIDDGLIDEALIKMYPNPATNEFTLDLTSFNGQPIEISIVNGSGLGVYAAHDIRSSKHTVRVGNYSQGIYIVVLQSGKQLIQKKLIIRR